MYFGDTVGIVQRAPWRARRHRPVTARTRAHCGALSNVELDANKVAEDVNTHYYMRGRREAPRTGASLAPSAGDGAGAHSKVQIRGFGARRGLKDKTSNGRSNEVARGVCNLGP